ncbi:hypothetical protein [Candidatus Ferrigenium straubiae]|jgi:hypothetical protein|uniref:hypothetical protein n=1 Tax=Candidatus Ferrigenium straubiae TaxID=2919506 RepID=UPI003F4AE483
MKSMTKINLAIFLILSLCFSFRIVLAHAETNTPAQIKEIPWSERSWEDKVFKSTHDDNYTFQNRGTYVLDPYIWAYTKEFAERFRMPEEWIEPELKGAYAVAWRMTTIGEIMCGYGGKADNCWKPLNCQMDIYYDNRIDLSWVTDRVRDNLMNGLSSGRFLGLTPASREKQISRLSVMNSGGSELRYGKYRQGGASLALFDREYDPGIGLLSYIGSGVCPQYIGPEKVQMIYENSRDLDQFTKGHLKRNDVRPIHIIEFPQRFLQRANAAYNAQNKPNEDVMNNLIRSFFDSRKGNTK